MRANHSALMIIGQSPSNMLLYIFSLMIPPPPRSTLFPYTTLFRSSLDRTGGGSRAMTERQTPRRQDAKPQGIDRRAFVTLGLGSGAAALLAACGWDGGSLVRPGLWSISRVNDWVEIGRASGRESG